MIFERLRAPQWHVLREVRERGSRGGGHELGAGDGGVSPDEFDDLGTRLAVLDVGRDLDARRL
jgi:hypothetical protein